MSWFNPGDEVIFKPKQIGAKVIRAMPNSEYLVEWDDKNLIPPQMSVPESSLMAKPVTLYGGYYNSEMPRDPRFIDKATHCPKCDIPWTKTQGFRDEYFDCLKCGLKKEKA